jgi:magnesium transporter
MEQHAPPESWEHLEELLRQEDTQQAATYLVELPPGETARALSRLQPEARVQVLTALRPEDAAHILEGLVEIQAVDLIDDLPIPHAAAIINALPSDEQADLLGELEEEHAETILQAMAPEEAKDVRLLSQYPQESAGGLMITEYLVYPNTAQVKDVLDDLRTHAERYATYDVQYAYVTSPAGVLDGVLRLRDLLLTAPTTPVAAIRVANPLLLSTEAPLEELRQFFDHHGFFGAPVVDSERRLVGVVRRADVEEALGDRADQNLLKVSGIVGGEELRSMPLRERSSRRLSWLSINILLNVIAASVIAVYQDTLSAVIALAVFLPIISDMSGCSGNQAVAVSLRELTLGLVRPNELVLVLAKEAGVGIINGVVLGLLLGAVVWLWQGNPFLGVVVGGALALNTLVAVVLGGSIPLLLRRFKMDPALASGPILTTITDMCGFFFTLSFATAVLPQLVR